MPPQKSRTAPDDSRSEASSTKEKLGNPTLSALNGKGRRVISGLGTGSSLRDVTSAGSATTTSIGPAKEAGGAAQDANVGIQWSAFEPSILQGYRHSYRLNTPSAFSSSYNQILLSQPGIGRMSPTMARHKERRRQSKDHLAKECRKHFNGLGIQENEVVVDFLYKVRYQDKNFRMRFAPQRSR